MSPRAALTFATACATAACTTGEESLRVGAGAGSVWTIGSTDRDRPVDDPELENGTAFGGFVELMSAGETSLHVRVLGSRHELDVRDTMSTADLQQYLSTTMVSRTFEPFDGVVLRPMLGLGFGYVDVDFESPSQRDEQGLAGLFTGGLELEFAHHALVGVQAWAGIFGEPDDTEGELQSALFYAGVRF